MFSQLKKLQIGDEIILTDNLHGVVRYEVFDKFKVNPDETKVVSQKTQGEKQLTLITCSDYLAKRIIVKAKQKEAI